MRNQNVGNNSSINDNIHPALEDEEEINQLSCIDFCVCNNPKITGNFCSNCGFKSALKSFQENSNTDHESYLRPFRGNTKNNNLQHLFGSVKTRIKSSPYTLQNTNNNSENEDIYTEIPARIRPQYTIDSVRLVRFAHQFDPVLQENLNIFIPPIEVLNIDNNLPSPNSSSEDDNSDSDDHSIEHDDLNFEDLAEQFEIDNMNM